MGCFDRLVIQLNSDAFNSAAAIETITVTGSYCGDEEDELDINDQIEQDMIDLQEEMNADMLAELQAEIDQALDDALAEDVYEPTREECQTTTVLPKRVVQLMRK